MRRSPANSTHRSLAAFGKLQHIRTECWCATVWAECIGSVDLGGKKSRTKASLAIA